MFAKWFANTFAKPYRAAVAKNLKTYGLKYEDLLVESPEVLKAIERSPKNIQVERARRLKRAFDLDAKKKSLPEDQAKYNPYDLYLRKQIDIAKFEKNDRLVLEN